MSWWLEPELEPEPPPGQRDAAWTALGLAIVLVALIVTASVLWGPAGAFLVTLATAGGGVATFLAVYAMSDPPQQRD